MTTGDEAIDAGARTDPDRAPRDEPSLDGTPAFDRTRIAALALLDHDEVAWDRVQRTAFLINQRFHYEYPGPIRDLVHRLMIVPPEHHGDQRRVVYHLDTSVHDYRLTDRTDAFGNLVLRIEAPEVDATLEFEAWIVVERRAGAGPHLAPRQSLDDRRLYEPSDLTAPDDALRRAADELWSSGDRGETLAARINDWVYGIMTYRHEVTDIGTTASEVLALRQGICQDYAHLMIALCRLCGLAARYVSGHLLGEGGTHAWVEVLLPGEDDPDHAVVVPFDPTHGRRVGLSYVTVAVGRDYRDVAPTSGYYTAPYRSRLSAGKRVSLTAVEYAGS